MTAIRPQFVLFGDSITQKSFGPGGWAGLLADAYQRRVDVINRGYSGYNTRWALSLVEPIFPANITGKIELATVFFGANDAALADRTS
jgi:lysophospholipase L1-like esterase